MIQSIELQSASPARPACERVTLWDLTARQLHEAYWHARGVQCVRRGDRRPLQRAAELFLLIEPEQLVLFDLGELSERLAWRKAALTRLRIIVQEARSYSEQVIVDERGLVQRIERRYRPRTGSSHRVMLTCSRRVARLWIAASSRREGWVRVRRAVAWSRLDHWRCPGGCFTEGDHAQENALLSRLVACWPDPAQAIHGIQQVGERVWTLAGEPLPGEALLIGPAWLGRRGLPGAGSCVIGPGWTADQVPAGEGNGATAGVRPIRNVAISETGNGVPRSVRTNAGYALAKRMFDIVCSVVVLLAGLPMFAIVAVCIALEDGRPVFYGHLRQSRGGRPFRCWKFRTMFRNASKLTRELAAKNICDGPQVFIPHDPRVTRLGHLLRRLQIDEFPQFWNVLLGQMSIVGPRPSPEQENQYCPAWRDLRLSVRPGITGLWQLKRTRARGEDFQEWIRYDLEYVRRASFWFDLILCVQTAWVLLTGRRTLCG